ncbi:hypothetical protein MRX96_028185 [Rhipicephalus microplus]
MARAASNQYSTSDENAPQDALSYMALWNGTRWRQTDRNVAPRFEDSNQYEHRSPGRDGTFALEQRGLGVSPLGRGFEARACSWSLTRGQGLPRMSGIELLGSLCADSLGTALHDPAASHATDYSAF